MTEAPSPLREALDVVRERGESYGPPHENHETIAAFWTTYLRRRGLLDRDDSITMRDACLMMVLVKVARDAFRVGHDNLVDIAGYAENASLVTEGET